MKIVKFLLLGLIGLAVLLVAGGFFVPNRYEVTRSITIEASADAVHPLVVDLERWQEWDPWSVIDPDMEIEVTGDPGVGQKKSWKSDDPQVGEGTQEIVWADPEKGVDFDMFVSFPFTANLRYEPTGEGETTVTWTCEGEFPRPFFSYFTVLADGMIGKSFEDGLAKLKRVVESQEG